MRTMRGWLPFVVLLAAGPAEPGEVRTLQVTMPFAFTVAETQMPAGDYAFTLDVASGQVSIRGRKSRTATQRAVNLPFQGDVYAVSQRYEVVVNRYDEDNFLSQVWIQNTGMEVARSEDEAARQREGKVPRVLKLKVRAK